MYDCRQTPDAFASGRFGARDCPLRFDGTGRPRRPVSTRWPRAGLSPAVPCCRTPRSPPAPRRRLRPSPASPPLVERGLGQASPMWRSTPRRTWCASTALQATTPASVALSHHQSLSDSGEPRPTPRAQPIPPSTLRAEFRLLKQIRGRLEKSRIFPRSLL